MPAIKQIEEQVVFITLGGRLVFVFQGPQNRDGIVEMGARRIALALVVVFVKNCQIDGGIGVVGLKRESFLIGI